MSGAPISAADALQRVRGLVAYDRKLGDIAEQLGCSHEHVRLMLNGKRTPSDDLLALAGIERRLEFYEKDGEPT